MLYNPDFFAGLDDEKRRGVLLHEFYHLVFRHVCDRLPDEGLTKAWNIATDLAINSYLSDMLPEFACIPGAVGTPFEDYPPFLSSEQYLAMLKKDPNIKKKSGGGSGFEPMDDHSGWGGNAQGNEESEEIAKERLNKIMQEASNEADNQGWGSVSSEIRKKIEEGLKTIVDWRTVLRFFVKASQKARKKSSIRKINRRFPYIHAGKRSERVANIAISIDQSGSVSDQMLTAFFAELCSLAKIAEFTVIPFDTRVSEKDVFVWKRGKNIPCSRVLTGGTCFDAPTQYVNERSFDGHIILTDMEAGKPKSSKCRRMWMTTSRHASNCPFETSERIISVDG